MRVGLDDGAVVGQHTCQRSDFVFLGAYQCIEYVAVAFEGLVFVFFDVQEIGQGLVDDKKRKSSGGYQDKELNRSFQ